MADKPTCTDIAAGSQYTAAVLNNNFAILETAIEGCLGRGGTDESPNSMQGDLDLDLHDILNVNEITSELVEAKQFTVNGEPVYFQADVVSLLSETQDLVSGQLSVIFINPTVYGAFYITGSDVDQGRLLVNVDYTPNHATQTITLTDSYPTGTKITMVYLEGGEQTLSNMVVSYPDIDSLRTVTGSDEVIAYLAEEGRAGNFYWDSSDLSTEVTADTQSGIYVAPSSDPTGHSGAWVRQYSGAVNVKWFGAVGDGVTDDSNAFTAADAASNEATYVPYASYELSAVDYTGKKFFSFGTPIIISGTISITNLVP